MRNSIALIALLLPLSVAAEGVDDSGPAYVPRPSSSSVRHDYVGVDWEVANPGAFPPGVPPGCEVDFDQSTSVGDVVREAWNSFLGRDS